MLPELYRFARRQCSFWVKVSAYVEQHVSWFKAFAHRNSVVGANRACRLSSAGSNGTEATPVCQVSVLTALLDEHESARPLRLDTTTPNVRCLVLRTLSIRVIVQAPTSLTRRDRQHSDMIAQPPWRPRRGNVAPVVFVWGVDERQGYFFCFCLCLQPEVL